MVLLWKPDEGLTALDKYLYTNDDNVKAGALLAMGITIIKLKIIEHAIKIIIFANKLIAINAYKNSFDINKLCEISKFKLLKIFRVSVL